MNRPPIIFTPTGPHTFARSRAGYHAVRECDRGRYSYRLYQNGEEIDCFRTFNELGPNAMRHEALQLREGVA